VFADHLVFASLSDLLEERQEELFVEEV